MVLTALLLAGVAVAATTEPMLADFSSRAVLDRAAACGLSATVLKDSRGKPEGAEVTFPGGEAWRGLVLRVPSEIARADWNGWEEAVLDVENPGTAGVNVSLQIRSEPDTWDMEKVAAFHVEVPAGKRVTWPVRIFHLRYTQGWEWPALPWGERAGSWGRVDTGKVVEAWIGVNAKAPVRLVLRRLSLAKPIPAKGWVDKYGQRSNLAWPGKVRRDSDLGKADKQEQAELSTAKRDLVYDDWHAWARGPERKATGFFRTEEVDGRWWLVAPNGKLFFMTGVDCVGPWSTPRMDDTVRAAYSWLPPEKGALSEAWGFWWLGVYYPKGGPSIYRANVIRKWGTKDLDDKSLRRAVYRLLAWQFSSIGNWSDERITGMKKLPYVNIGPPVWEVETPKATEKIHDPFHPRFAEEARRVAAKLAGFRDDPWLIGHFIDNEVDWHNVPRMVLEAAPDLPARGKWTGELRKKYRAIDRLNEAWGASATSWETLRFPRDRDAKGEAREDAAEFRGAFADAWYRTWGEAVRAADPNHLVLGSRLHGGNRFDEVVAACAKWMDVVSFNHYDEEPTAGEYGRYYGMAKKPFMIGEYGFNSLDDGLLTAAVPVASREERGVGYRWYTERMAALPYFVGGHWFQWIDEPITGRGDGETSYNGFIKVTDIPDPFLVEAAKATNPRVYGIHAGTEKPVERRPKR